MAVHWTKEQQQVIDLRNQNLLVSAAAGSGKTAVLVERILAMVTDPVHPKDIDQLLVVTFTRAAAAEMKERISAAISAKLDEDPENEHLQRQSVLLHNAQISTIHGFCTYVIQNYFHKTDLDPAYRIAEEGELKLLRGEVLQEMLEEAYADADKDFLHFVEGFAGGKDDKNLEDIIQRLYNFANATPDPDEWLDQCVENCLAADADQLQQKPWMQELVQEAKRLTASLLNLAEENLQDSLAPGGPGPYVTAVQDDLCRVEQLWNCDSYEAFQKLFAAFAEMGWAKFGRVTAKMTDINPNITKRVKERRERLKKSLDALQKEFFQLSVDEILAQLALIYPDMAELVQLTKLYGARYAAIKRERNVLDFSDLEHYALGILLEKNEQGWVRTEAARELSSHFVEVMTDEYQDSNYLQEYLLEAVSGTEEKRFDRFMVGDMKQSIYAFRMARPDLFMEKYNTYSSDEAVEGISCRKIDLHKNFRSRAEVLDATNAVFRKLMTRELGGILYDDAAALYQGNTDYPAAAGNEYMAELLLLDGSASELQEDQSRQTRQETEALLVAQRIRELLVHGRVLDKESKELRPVQYRDIVILLRSEKEQANNFVHVLQGQGIPAYAPSKTGYFSALEVVTVLNYLRILDNPQQEIPYTAVLRSPMVGCTDTELAFLRSKAEGVPVYQFLPEYLEKSETAGEAAWAESFAGEDAACPVDEEGLRKKLRRFLKNYSYCRDMAMHVSMDELIREILQSTGYDRFAAAMPAGMQRAANLQMLIEKAVQFEKSSYQGLFQFIRYIDHLQKYKVDFGEVNIFGEAENTVRIMTIHKSKGLEFPIVFLCGMGNQFNAAEQKEKIVQHSTLGIGMKEMNPTLHISRSTPMEKVIKNTLKRDALGEELRVLYVAMTRAREKLIMTGRVKDPEEVYELCERFDGSQPTVSGPEKETTHAKAAGLDYSILVRAKSYLDWMLSAMQDSSREEMPIMVRLISPAQMALQEMENDHLLEERLQEISDLWNKGSVQAQEMEESDYSEAGALLQKKKNFVYPYEYLRRMPAKLSVSDIKKAQIEAMQEEKGEEAYVNRDFEAIIPAFMKEQDKYVAVGAQRGTNYHRLFECLDYARIPLSMAENAGSIPSGERISQGEDALVRILDDMVSDIIREGKMSAKDAASVELQDIALFLRSSIGQRMKRAADRGMLFREQPFVMDVPAVMLHYPETVRPEDAILVQGIIDAYFIEDGQIVIVDYKTDRVKDAEGQELVEHYRSQLMQYKEAVERATGLKVKETLIYSVTIGREIPV